MSLDLNFMEEAAPTVSSTIEQGPGYNGAELKNLVPNKNDSRTFIIPFGTDMELSYPDGETFDPKHELPGYNIIQFWMNVSDLNDAAKSVLIREGSKSSMFTRQFLGASKTTGNEWWLDLGYVSTAKEERELADVITNESWRRVYHDSSKVQFYAGNAVMPQVWHNIPLVEVIIDGKGKNKTYSLGNAVWMKLKPNQLEDFMKVFVGLDEPPITNRMVLLHNSGEGMNRYSWSRLEGTAPEELWEPVQEARKMVEERITNLLTSIYENNHGSVAPTANNPTQDKKSNDNVRAYLLSITNFDTWDEFVEAYNIRAEPLTASELEDLGEFALNG